MKWTTREGNTLDIKDMSNQHIKNCIAVCERKNVEGVLVGGMDGGEVWADKKYNYYDSHLKEFKKELERRGKI